MAELELGYGTGRNEPKQWLGPRDGNMAQPSKFDPTLLGHVSGGSFLNGVGMDSKIKTGQV